MLATGAAESRMAARKLGASARHVALGRYPGGCSVGRGRSTELGQCCLDVGNLELRIGLTVALAAA